MTRNTVKTFLVWGILPNLPFLALAAFLSFQRTSEFFVFFLLFLTLSISARIDVSNGLRRTVSWVVYLTVILLTISSAMTLVGRFFGLRFTEVFASLPMLLRLDITAYPLYMAIGLFLFGTLATFIYLSRKTIPQSRSEIATVSALLLSLCTWDFFINYQVVGSAEARNASFTNAIDAGGILDAQFVGEERDLLIVVVEALGQFKDPRAADAVLASFTDPELTDRYDIVKGTVPYEGSTTAAEMRELCSSTNSYLDILDDDFDTSACLPNILGQRGYSSTSYHGFNADVFDRNIWYPEIGFGKSHFAKNLVDLVRNPENRRYNLCGGTFKGLCDRDIGEQILHRMETGQGKTFNYWLTLNSHFPVKSTEGYGGKFPCQEHGLEKDGQICIMTEYWQEVFETTIKIAKSKRIRPTNILIVGDHAPPLLVRSQRERFRFDAVPFIALKYKGEELPSQNQAQIQAPARSKPETKLF
ncbi:sulfatase-like hydrolase/transferase [Pseudomonadota bacterium]